MTIFFDQALVSVSNFGTSILLARSVSPEEFGFYVLAFSGMLFVQSVQNAILTSPMLSIGATLSGRDSKCYLGGLCKAQGLLSLVASFIAIILYFIFFKGLGQFFLMSFGLLAFAWQAQEFVRRLFFTCQQVSRAFGNDLISYGLQLVLVSFLYWKERLGLVDAFFVMGITSGLACIFGALQCRREVDLGSPVKLAFVRNLAFGKWLLGANALTWTSAHGISYLTALFVGVNGPAVLQACGNILGPTNLLLNGSENVLPPIAARKYREEGSQALGKFIGIVAVCMVSGLIIYTCVVGISAKEVLGFLYKGKYTDYWFIVWIMGATYTVSGFMRSLSLGLRSILRPEGIFRAYLIGSVMTVFIGIPLIWYKGVYGAAVTSFLVAAATALSVKYSYRKAIAIG